MSLRRSEAVPGIDDHRLAYQVEAAVNWCPELGRFCQRRSDRGVSERGGYPVMRIPLRQWMLRITVYADRLANDLDDLDWPESIKLLQKKLDRKIPVPRSISSSAIPMPGSPMTPHLTGGKPPVPPPDIRVNQEVMSCASSRPVLILFSVLPTWLLRLNTPWSTD